METRAEIIKKMIKLKDKTILSLKELKKKYKEKIEEIIKLNESQEIEEEYDTKDLLQKLYYAVVDDSSFKFKYKSYESLTEKEKKKYNKNLNFIRKILSIIKQGKTDIKIEEKAFDRLESNIISIFVQKHDIKKFDEKETELFSDLVGKMEAMMTPKKYWKFHRPKLIERNNEEYLYFNEYLESSFKMWEERHKKKGRRTKKS